MNIVVPMAGMGKRMRPHTLTTPKPLLKVAGKPMVQRLVEDIARVTDEKIDEIAFVVGRFGAEAENHLIDVARSLGAKGSIYYQDEPLGTAHAILCASPCLKGKTVVAFADTLFKADFKMDSSSQGTIWVQKIENPEQFGVVKISNDGFISDFVEKPKTFVSDLAIIGIYYFADGENLKKELQYLIDNNIKDKGEFQLTNALENMKKKGMKFVPGKVSEWLDCGNKDATLHTNAMILDFVKTAEKLVAESAVMKDSELIQPCYVGPGAIISGSKIGPNVSVGANTKISNSTISNSIVGEQCVLVDATLSNSMLGNFVEYSGACSNASLGDYCTHKN
jgi:glucose-1-phosphate thymidylyltransferase